MSRRCAVLRPVWGRRPRRLASADARARSQWRRGARSGHPGCPSPLRRGGAISREARGISQRPRRAGGRRGRGCERYRRGRFRVRPSPHPLPSAANLRAAVFPTSLRSQPHPPPTTPPRFSPSPGGRDAFPPRDDGGGRSSILRWIARQLANQAKAIPLLRWPTYGIFNHRTWVALVVDSVIVTVAIVALTAIMGGADVMAARLYKLVTGMRT